VLPLHSLHLYLHLDFGIAFQFQLYCLALCTDSFHRTDQPLSFFNSGAALCWKNLMKLIAQLILIVVVVAMLGSFVFVLGGLWLLIYLAGWHK